jgi:hypothetical protein
MKIISLDSNQPDCNAALSSQGLDETVSGREKMTCKN